MSKSLKDAESLHTDQQDANIISSVGSSSEEAGQKMIKLKITHMMRQQIGYQKNVETSSTRKQNKRHKSRKRKIVSLSSSPELVKYSNKKSRKNSTSRREKRNRSLSSSSSPSISSSSSSTKSENEIVSRRFKLVLEGEQFKWNLLSSMADYANLHF